MVICIQIILDIIDTKLNASETTTLKKSSPPRYTLPIKFDKKPVELIKILQMLNHPDVTGILPGDI